MDFESKNDFRKIRYLRKITRLSDDEFNRKALDEKAVIVKLKRFERKLTYKYDFWKFILEVMDAEKKGEQPVKLAKVHWRICRTIRRARNLGLNCRIMVPRYHLKTQIATTYYRIWRLVNTPELCGLIVSGTLELSKDTARSIKHELVNNPKLKLLYPEVLPDWIRNERKNKWAETEFNVARKNSGAQCTIEAVGVNATVTGKHFGELSFDDVATKENSQNPEQCQKVINSYRYFQSIVNLKRQQGRIPIMVVGTNYTDHDIYAFLDEPEIAKSFLNYRQIVWDEQGDPIWPEQWTKESLKEIEVTQGTYIWSTQYLLDPVPEEQQEFKRNWIQIYHELPTDVNKQAIPLEKIIMVDPITAKKTDSGSHDRGVILACGWDKRKNIYVLDYLLYSRAKESELFDGIFQMSDKWNIKKCLWEDVAYQAQGKINLEEKARQFNKQLTVIPVNPGHRDKDFRIRTMIAHFERGQFFIRYWMQDLIAELVRFPAGRTKDILDCLSYVLRFVCKNGQAKGMWRTEQSQGNRAWYR